MTSTSTFSASQSGKHREPLMGLASLARLAFAGQDLQPIAVNLQSRALINPDDANALLDLSVVMHLSGNRETGLLLQQEAIRQRPNFSLPASIEPSAIRLLVLLAPGDLTENNAIEFLTEESDIAIEFLFVRENTSLAATAPNHDLAIVAVCESDRNRNLLHQLDRQLREWPKPVLNQPLQIARLSRDGACELLQSQPGIVFPRTARLSRAALEQTRVLADTNRTAEFDSMYSMIIRPVDSHKGQGLEKLDTSEALAQYLQVIPGDDFYVAKFVDYRSSDDQYRKYRVVLIDGRPYACHMAISKNWMVHYMNAGMAENAAKRGEEKQFMETFDGDFARRHRAALSIVADRLGLDYVGIDCGETLNGELLIFEFDSGMTVHSMDSIELFPYKRRQMRKVFGAFRQMLLDTANR